ncbi:MAG TPA: alpha/beta hydrolase [Phototrophicaceae bacterium]|nr:alpha/beta hydrolase [Phototrophicaceae bacterium]
MADMQTGFAEINGAKTYYEVAGQDHDQTVVFVHAGVSDHRLWDGQFDLYARRYRVIRYDLRGFGQTTAPTMQYAHHEDLRALLDFLKVDQAALIGCSMGGTTALDFLLTDPQRVTALVMVCSNPSGYQPQGAPTPLIQQLIAAHQAHDPEAMAQVAVQLWAVGEKRELEQVDSKVRDLVYAMSLIGFQNQDTLGEAQGIEPPAIGRLNEVRVPTLIIDGAFDSPVVHAAGAQMAREIAGAKRVIMPNSAHLPSLEHPANFNTIVEPFLASALKC